MQNVLKIFIHKSLLLTQKISQHAKNGGKILKKSAYGLQDALKKLYNTKKNYN